MRAISFVLPAILLAALIPSMGVAASICFTNYGTCYLSDPVGQGSLCACSDSFGNFTPGIVQDDTVPLPNSPPFPPPPPGPPIPEMKPDDLTRNPFDLTILDTAYAPLYSLGDEVPGYGLYSYVVVLGSGDRDRAIIKTIIDSTPTAEGLPWSHAQINLLLLPTEIGATAQCGFYVKDNRADCIRRALADLAAYDHTFAQTLLYRICGSPPKEMVVFCSSAFGRGPFLLTYSRPASALDSIPPPFLFVDLSSVEQGAFAEYIEAFKAQVKREDITDGSKINTLRLRVLSLILSGTGLIDPVEKAIADILHVPDASANK